MLDKIRTLVGHTLIYGLGNLGGRFVGFLLIPVYTRYLTPVDYGVLALVAMLDQLLFIVMNMGQSSGLFRAYFRREDQAARDTVLTTSLWLIVMLSLPMGMVALLLSGPLGRLLTGSPEYTTWIAIGIGGVIFKIVLRLPMAVLRAREQSRVYALASSIRTLVGIVLAIVFVVGLHWGGRGVLMSQLVCELLLAAALVPLALRKLPLRFSRYDAKDLLGYGAFIVPNGLINFTLHLSDRFFLRHFSTLGAVGLYALGYRMGEILSFAISALALAWPQFLFANRTHPDAPRIYARVFTYVATVLGFLWIGVALLAKEMVTIMAHPSFREAYQVVPWVAGAFLLEGLTMVGNVGMPMRRKVKYRPAILVTIAALNVGLNFALVPRYGPVGAAGALCGSMGAKFVLELIVGNRLYPVPYEYARLARLAAVGAGIYVLGAVVDWGSLSASVSCKVSLLVVGPILLFATGFFDREEIRHLRASVGRAWRSTGVLPSGGRP